MAVSPGRTLGDYKTDLFFLPAHIAIDVPNNLFAEASIKWVAAPAGSPRRVARFTPRHIVGVTPAGKHGKLIVPDVTADVWTGVATTWAGVDNIGGAVTYTITGYIGEKASL